MRPIRAVALALLSAVIAASIAYFVAVRPKLRAWGVDPREAELGLPGDDLITEPSTVETRGITIHAPIARVWPYLVQMGFGRAGWYSYDVLDNKGPSTEGILPEFQHLAVGDIVPTHPAGGFEVKLVEPERSLVLYTDTALIRSQTEKAHSEGTTDLPTPGLKASGALMGASYPEFTASWAFYLEPTPEGGTRLIERFRAQTPGDRPINPVLGEIMGTGIVLMTRKQMLGIKERVERAVEPAPAPSFSEESVAEPELVTMTLA